MAFIRKIGAALESVLQSKEKTGISNSKKSKAARLKNLDAPDSLKAFLEKADGYPVRNNRGI